MMRLTKLPVLPFIIAYILGGIFERTARQAFASTGADPYFLFSSPISILLMLTALGIVISFSRKNRSS